MRKVFSICLILPAIGSFLFAEDSINYYGDLRTKWEHIDSKVNSDLFKIELRGGAKFINEDFSGAVELKTTCALTEGVEKVSIDIEKAFFTYDVSENAFLTIGRNSFSNLFDSKIQYGSKFNGAIIGYDFGLFSFCGGGMLVSKDYDFYGAVAQLQSTPFNFPLQFGYSTTYWGVQKSFSEYGMEYLISQLTATYLWEEKIINQPFQLLGGFLWNHRSSNHQKGWYFGCVMGTSSPKNAQEWNIGVSFQSIEQYAIPQHDLNGIGKGKSSHGVVLEGIYSINDKLSFKSKLEIGALNQDEKQSHNYLEIGATCKF